MAIACGIMPAADGVDFQSDSPTLFDRPALLVISIEISQDGLESLRRNPRSDVRALIRHEANSYTNVAVHLKGSKLGSFRAVDDKPSLTLDFDDFAPGQRFHSLRKVHLNNSVEDPTYLAEAFSSEIFRRAGVPTPQIAHARVTLNGQSRGIYVVKEGFDAALAGRWFEDPAGNFYEPTVRADITAPMALKSGDHGSGLLAITNLVRAARHADPSQRWHELGKVLDRERFISFLAAEVVTWHWDGYGMNRNNYRLYHHAASGKLIFMPQGMDVMFDEPAGPLFPRWEGILATAVLECPEGRREYLKRVEQLLETSLDPLQVQRILAPLQERLLPAMGDSGSVQRYHAALMEFRTRIAGRARSLTRQLAQERRLEKN